MASRRVKVLSNWRSALLVGIASLGLGIVGAWAILHEPAVDQAQAVQSMYPLEPQQYLDTQPASILVDPPQTRGIEIRVSGVVTETNCTEGAVLESGESLATIDGQIVIALATDVPFYRTLSVGDTGADVTSLKRELNRIGYLPKSALVLEKFDSATVQALKELYASASSTKSSQTADHASNTDGAKSSTVSSVRLTRFEPENYTWLPSVEVHIAECTAELGKQFQSGDFAQVEYSNPQVSARIPAVAVAGDRTLSLDGLVLAADEDGIVASKDAEALLDSPSYAGALLAKEQGGSAPSAGDTGDPLQLQGQYSLTSPITVYSIPPVSIVPASAEAESTAEATDNTASTSAATQASASGPQASLGCVYSATGVHKVSLISSSLGMTYIEFLEGEQVPSEILINPGRDQTCG